MRRVINYERHGWCVVCGVIEECVGVRLVHCGDSGSELHVHPYGTLVRFKLLLKFFIC